MYNTHAVLPNTTATNLAKEPATVQLSQAAMDTPLDEAAVASGNPGDACEISRQPKHAALHNATHKQLLAVCCKLCCNWHSSVDLGNTPYGPSQCE